MVPREQINPRDPVNPRDPLRQQQPRGAECSAHWCCAAARGKGGRAVRGRFHSSGSVRGSFPGAALTPTVTVRPRSRGSPAGSSPGNWPRSRGASPHCPAGRDREFWGHPRLVWSGAAPTGCPCGGTCTGHQERDAATALRLDPEGRRGPGEELGTAVQMAPRDWVLVPRGAGLVGFLLRAGGVDHRGPCPTQCPQISLHLPEGFTSIRPLGAAWGSHPAPGAAGGWQPPGLGALHVAVSLPVGLGREWRPNPTKCTFPAASPAFSCPLRGAVDSGHRGRSKTASAEPVHGGALKIP